MARHHNEGGDDDTPSHFEVTNPVNLFAHLPEPTRRWLENLREDDLADLVEAARFHRSAKTVGRFVRWLILSLVAIFLTAAQFGEAIQKLFALLKPGAK